MSRNIPNNKSMYAKALRDATGVSRDTLRHYVAIGLLTPTRDPKNDYLVYSDEDHRTLDFVLRAKNLGFTLEEIKRISKRLSTAECPHQSILPSLRNNLAVVHDKIADLQVIEQHLQDLITDFTDRDCHTRPTKFNL